MAEAVAVHAAAGGVRLRLRVRPGARRTRLVGAHGGALKLEVAAPAERGRANHAVILLLAGALGVARDRVVLVAGETSQDKIVELLGADPSEIVANLAQAGIPADVRAQNR